MLVSHLYVFFGEILFSSLAHILIGSFILYFCVVCCVPSIFISNFIDLVFLPLFLDDGHSDWSEVMPHCSFDLHFSNNEPC